MKNICLPRLNLHHLTSPLTAMSSNLLFLCKVVRTVGGGLAFREVF